ncbi:methyltransferase domain-containing protein [Bradyrhizobium sp. sGM-13]|uniref:methyltransferase domain-containing protein n=1 Tax=Bradyrhizobium sp. sGM-13 TaxID=2831781 RepID=UPI001BCF87DD|nr:methyltransferase domain-containing protein [Bradyrhizobium sp. sGM-13]
MTSPVSQTLIDAARTYEALFVPALFQQWAPMVADAARIERGDRVLDVACGTGVLAREAARRTESSGRVAGLDPNAGMLAVARDLAPGIDWRDGAAEALPFPDRSFDVVVCQFGLMFFSDRDKAVREMLRVMVPGGRCAVAVWDVIEHASAFAALVDLLDRIAGKPAGDALRAPFVLGDRQGLAVLFKGAGAGVVDLTTCSGTARFPTIREFVEAELRGWLPVMGVVLPEPQIDRILAEAETIFARYLTADGLAFGISAHLATCRRP